MVRFLSGSNQHFAGKRANPRYSAGHDQARHNSELCVTFVRDYEVVNGEGRRRTLLLLRGQSVDQYHKIALTQ